jgi:hypothetical protein
VFIIGSVAFGFLPPLILELAGFRAIQGIGAGGLHMARLLAGLRGYMLAPPRAREVPVYFGRLRHLERHRPAHRRTVRRRAISLSILFTGWRWVFS